MTTKQRPIASDSVADRPVKVQEIDYAPKTYTLRQQMVIFLKLFFIGCITLFLFWLYDMYSGL